jgi:hypothetical protein
MRTANEGTFEVECGEEGTCLYRPRFTQGFGSPERHPAKLGGHPPILYIRHSR